MSRLLWCLLVCCLAADSAWSQPGVPRPSLRQALEQQQALEEAATMIQLEVRGWQTRRSYKEIRDKEATIDLEFGPVEEMYAMLNRYEVRVSKEEQDTVGELQLRGKFRSHAGVKRAVVLPPPHMRTTGRELAARRIVGDDFDLIVATAVLVRRVRRTLHNADPAAPHHEVIGEDHLHAPRVAVVRSRSSAAHGASALAYNQVSPHARWPPQARQHSTAEATPAGYTSER